jgi:hypothetical protein
MYHVKEKIEGSPTTIRFDFPQDDTPPTSTTIQILQESLASEELNKILPMWTCPKCKRTFRNAHQWHSCKTMDVIDHFENKPAIIKKTYEKLIDTVKPIGPVTIHAVKSAIFLKTNTTYIEIKPGKSHLLIGFYLAREVEGYPISKITRLSKNRFVHTIHLQSPADINRQVASWLKESYKLINAKVNTYPKKNRCL